MKKSIQSQYILKTNESEMSLIFQDGTFKKENYYKDTSVSFTLMQLNTELGIYMKHVSFLNSKDQAIIHTHPILWETFYLIFGLFLIVNYRSKFFF